MDNFIGEIRAFAGNFTPDGWNICDGSILNIADYQSLFTLLGTTYGGNGFSTFAVPDLRGRLIVNQGTGLGLTDRRLGETGGEEMVTLETEQIPSHTHTVNVSADPATATSPSGAYLAAPVDTVTTTNQMLSYLPGTFGGKTLQPLSPSTVASTGGQAHENRMPYLVVNYIIALTGTFPSLQ